MPRLTLAGAGNRSRLGPLLLAAGPGAMAGAATYLSRADTLVAAMPAEGGTRRAGLATTAEAEGIEMPEALSKAMTTLAD